MTLEQFVSRLEGVKPTRQGYLARCPAHQDTSPSLTVKDGERSNIVLHCFAGCRPSEVCASLGISLKDLFDDEEGLPRARAPKPWRPSPRPELAQAFDLFALDLRLASERILRAARHCADCDTWTDADRDLAMSAVERAYLAEERAQFCESYADHLRGLA